MIYGKADILNPGRIPEGRDLMITIPLGHPRAVFTISMGTINHAPTNAILLDIIDQQPNN